MTERETLTATAQIQEFTAGKTPNNKVWQKVKTDKGQFKSWGRKPDLETWETDTWVRFTYFEGDEWTDQHGNKRRDRIVIKAEGPVEAPEGGATPSKAGGKPAEMTKADWLAKDIATWRTGIAKSYLEGDLPKYALSLAAAGRDKPLSLDESKKVVADFGRDVILELGAVVTEGLFQKPEPKAEEKTEEKPAGGGGFVSEDDIPFERTL